MTCNAANRRADHYATGLVTYVYQNHLPNTRPLHLNTADTLAKKATEKKRS